jgi:hypothetical protein
MRVSIREVLTAGSDRKESTMQAPVFDGITRDLGEVSTRRRFFRLLGGAAALGAVAAVAQAEPAEARRKRNKRKNKKKQGTPTPPTNQPPQAICQRGTQMGAVSVPASGASVNTPVLAAGQRYRLRASGFWNTNATDGNDAVAAFAFATPNAPVLVAGGVRVGLAVGEDSPDLWGSYTTTHIYEREVTGQGAALSLRYVDPITADNSGSLLVDVFCA